MSTPQFYTDPLSSTNRFHTRTTPFQHPKSVSSTPKALSSTPKTPQFHPLLLVWNWGVFVAELRDFGAEKEWPFCEELRGCGTEGDPAKRHISDSLEFMTSKKKLPFSWPSISFAFDFCGVVFFILRKTVIFIWPIWRTRNDCDIGFWKLHFYRFNSRSFEVKLKVLLNIIKIYTYDS